MRDRILDTVVDTNRAVAEWAIVMGGAVVLDSDRRRIVNTADLPPVAFQIRILDLVGANVEPADLERLSGLAGLRELYLPGPMWNRNADGGKDRSTDLRYLTSVSGLQKLTFSYHFLDRIRFHDAGLDSIQGLSGLRELCLRQSGIKGHTLAAFKSLAGLDVSITPFDDAGMGNLTAMAGLRRLWIGDTLVTDTGIGSISGLQNLEDLDLHGTAITDAGLAKLSRLTHLRKLNLMGTSITDAGLEIVREMRDLEYLNLYRTKVTNAGLDRLKPLTALREIDLRYTRVSRGGIDNVRAALVRTAFVFIDAAPVMADKPVPEPSSKSEESIARWIRGEHHLIAQNDPSNRGAPVRWTRIAWVLLTGVPPYTWAFCFSAFDAPTAAAAESVVVARPETPKTGCNTFPFSRMQRGK